MNKLLNTMILLSAGSEDLPGGSIISFDSELVKNTLVIWFNVILLIIIMVVLLYKPVRNYMDNRSRLISDRLDHAKTTREEAEHLKEQYEKKLGSIEKEREEILAQAHKRAMEQSEHILKEARKEAENIYQQAMAEIEEEKESVQEEMKRELVELSVLVAGRFVEETLDEEAHNKLIEEALADWEEGLWLN